MRKSMPIFLIFLLQAPLACPQTTKTPVSPSGHSVATSSQGVVVSGKPAATASGIKILQQGGNAADAGAATLLKAIACYMQHGIPEGDVKAAAVPGIIDAIVTLLKLTEPRASRRSCSRRWPFWMLVAPLGTSIPATARRSKPA